MLKFIFLLLLTIIGTFQIAWCQKEIKESKDLDFKGLELVQRKGKKGIRIKKGRHLAIPAKYEDITVYYEDQNNPDANSGVLGCSTGDNYDFYSYEDNPVLLLENVDFAYVQNAKLKHLLYKKNEKWGWRTTDKIFEAVFDNIDYCAYRDTIRYNRSYNNNDLYGYAIPGFTGPVPVIAMCFKDQQQTLFNFNTKEVLYQFPPDISGQIIAYPVFKTANFNDESKDYGLINIVTKKEVPISYQFPNLEHLTFKGEEYQKYREEHHLNDSDEYLYLFAEKNDIRYYFDWNTLDILKDITDLYLKEQLEKKEAALKKEKERMSRKDSFAIRVWQVFLDFRKYYIQIDKEFGIGYKSMFENPTQYYANYLSSNVENKTKPFYDNYLNRINYYIKETGKNVLADAFSEYLTAKIARLNSINQLAKKIASPFGYTKSDIKELLEEIEDNETDEFKARKNLNGLIPDYLKRNIIMDDFDIQKLIKEYWDSAK